MQKRYETSVDQVVEHPLLSTRSCARNPENIIFLAKSICFCQVPISGFEPPHAAKNGPAGIRFATDHSILNELSANQVRRVVEHDTFDVWTTFQRRNPMIRARKMCSELNSHFSQWDHIAVIVTAWSAPRRRRSVHFLLVFGVDVVNVGVTNMQLPRREVFGLGR